MSDRLAVALADVHEQYAAAHPNSRRLAERAARVLPGGNTRSVLHIEPFAFRVAGATGAVLHDVDGHDYVDLLGDYSAGLLGRRGEVADVIRGVLDCGWSYGAMSEPETLFAEAVVAAVPVDRAGALHQLGHRGQRDGADDRSPRHRPRPCRRVRRRLPRRTAVLRARRRAAADPVRLRRAAVQRHRRRRGRVRRPGSDIACVLVEPMLGSGGCIPGDPEFLAALRRLTDRARRGAHLRRGDDLPSRRRWCPVAARRSRRT